MIICGDLGTALKFQDTNFLNYKVRIPGFTAVERKNLQKFLLKGWVDTYRIFNGERFEYSWRNIKENGFDSKIGKRVDYFIVNENLKKYVLKSEIAQEFVSIENSPIILQIAFV